MLRCGSKLRLEVCRRPNLRVCRSTLRGHRGPARRASWLEDGPDDGLEGLRNVIQLPEGLGGKARAPLKNDRLKGRPKWPWVRCHCGQVMFGGQRHAGRSGGGGFGLRKSGSARAEFRQGILVLFNNARKLRFKPRNLCLCFCNCDPSLRSGAESALDGHLDWEVGRQRVLGRGELMVDVLAVCLAPCAASQRGAGCLQGGNPLTYSPGCLWTRSGLLRVRRRGRRGSGLASLRRRRSRSSSLMMALMMKDVDARRGAR